MRKQIKTKNLKDAIKEKELQLAKLKLHVDKSAICSDLYNKVVLEKALLNKELQDLQNSNPLKVFKNFVPRKKTLICDYFRK